MHETSSVQQLNSQRQNLLNQQKKNSGAVGLNQQQQ
jgi:hypothetical protein